MKRSSLRYVDGTDRRLHKPDLLWAKLLKQVDPRFHKTIKDFIMKPFKYKRIGRGVSSGIELLMTTVTLSLKKYTSYYVMKPRINFEPL